MIEVTVQNIVASTAFADKLDLDMIIHSLEGTEYEPEQFPGLVYRIREPKVVLLLFSSGNIVCTGGKNVGNVSKAVEKLSKELDALGLFH